MQIDAIPMPAPTSDPTAQPAPPNTNPVPPDLPPTSTPSTMSAPKDPVITSQPTDPARVSTSSRAKDETAPAPPNAAVEHIKGQETPQRTSTPSSTRKSNAGSASGSLNAMRIQYLKKEDGQPFWRKDIQFNFLSRVFNDQKRVFTKLSNGSTDHTFSEIYIDAMAKSSKCSGTLKEKLISDNSSAIDMAMICLLVNVGRMNTTLNFFPEMRARVRTYHSIPCLQTQQGGKGLQDGPRLKSILKGATEDTPQPSTLEEIMDHAKPRTNPVNLVFVLSQYAPKVSSDHFPPNCDFFELFTRPTLSSESRARAFLWLVWWYLESDFSAEDALRNPFGAGEQRDGKGLPQMVPTLEVLSDEQAEAENLDTEEEKVFAEARRLEREDIVASDAPPSTGARRGKAVAELQGQSRRGHSPGSQIGSEVARSPGRVSHSPSRPTVPLSHAYHANNTRAVSPPTGFQAMNTTPHERGSYESRLGYLQSEDMQRTPSTASKRGAGRTSSARRGRDALIEPSGSSQPPLYPAPTPHHTMNPYQSTLNMSTYSNGAFTPDAESKGVFQGEPPGSSGETGRKVKKFVSLEQQRRQRVDRILWERTRDEQAVKRREQRSKGAFLEALLKCKVMPDGWDSDEDESHRLGGLDYLLPESRPITPNDADAMEVPVALGDIGAQAKAVSSGVRKFARGVEQIAIARPQALISGRRYEDSSFKDGIGSSSGAVPIVHTARMAIDDPRRKRPYKPRAKRNTDIQPSMGKLDMSTPGAKRKRAAAGSATKTKSGPRNGRGSKAGNASRAGELGVPISDFLKGADETAGSEVSASEKPALEDAAGEERSVMGEDGDTEMQGAESPRALDGDDDDEGDTEDALDDDDMEDGSDEDVEMADEA